MSFNLDDPRITAYVFDELDPQQRAAFQAELDQSEGLRQAVEQTRVTLQQLSNELQSEPQMALSDTQRQNVEEEIGRVSSDDANHRSAADVPPMAGAPSARRTWAMLAALAASLLLVCGLAYMVNQRDGGWRVAATPGPTDSGSGGGDTQARSSGELGLNDEEFDEMEMSSASEDVVSFDAAPGDGSGRPAAQRADAIAPPDDALMAGDLMDSAAVTGPASNSPMQQGRAYYDTEISGKKTRMTEAARPASGLPSGDTLMEMASQTQSGSYYGRTAPAAAKGKEGASSPSRPFGTNPARPTPAAAPAPAPSAHYGEEMGGYDAAGGYDDQRLATSPAAGQPASGGASYGGYGGGYGGAAGTGGMGGADYGSGANYGDAYGMESGYGPDVTTDYRAVAGGRRYLNLQPGKSVSALDASRPDNGTGPGSAGDRYEPIVENPFKKVTDHPLSTFSIDVDTASYSKVRMHLLQNNCLPRPDAVRIEELVNYFAYDYQPPEDDVPFAAHIEVADCPWTPGHRLVRFGIKGQEMDREERPTSNLVFLLDVSGSMSPANKLPLVRQGMKMLVDQLGENDRVAIVVYAGAAGLVLDSTTGDQKQVILDSLDRLHAGGSTNGGQGIRLAYQIALDNFVGGGVNRVILCTDGDFNVGTTGTDELVRLAEENAKTGVFLSVLGFGMGNHNDSMLEQVSNKGNGNYAFIDNEAEARKVLVEEMTGTLVTIAKDVKIQVEFNPAEVSAYRLIGYENRVLAAEDFNDDKKDAGEIGAGHTVTALYEVVPADAESSVATPPVDDLRYQSNTKLSKAAKSGEMLTLKMRYKQPDGDTSSLLTFPVKDSGNKFGQASQDFRFAAAVASFGMLLRNSQHRGNATYAGVLETATEAASGDTSGYRGEFLKMIERAKQLSGE